MSTLTNCLSFCRHVSLDPYVSFFNLLDFPLLFLLAVYIPNSKYLQGLQLKEINKTDRATLFLLGAVCQTACDFRMMDLQNKMVSFSGVDARLAKQENTTWTPISRCVYLCCQISVLPLLCPCSMNAHQSCLFFFVFSPQKHTPPRYYLLMITKGNDLTLFHHIVHRALSYLHSLGAKSLLFENPNCFKCSVC